MDIACICLAMPALLIVVAFTVLAIRVVSPGPIFYRQERVGYRRSRFMCWTFRSMKVNAEDTTPGRDIPARFHSNMATAGMDGRGNSRLIPFGALLRASGMDRLPQLINVWRGEMSLVGPRPCTPYELELYRPEQLERFDTLPGITGLWQVSGKNQMTFTEMVDLDIHYVRNHSPRLDLRIMTKTFGTVAGQVLQVTRRPAAALGVPAA